MIIIYLQPVKCNSRAVSLDIIEAITQRKSIRDFKNDQIPQPVIRDLLDIACRAPSAMNIQPWEFTVIANDVLDEIKSAIIEKWQAGEILHSEHSVVGWPSEGVHRRLRWIWPNKFPANRLETPRESVDILTTWCGFN